MWDSITLNQITFESDTEDQLAGMSSQTFPAPWLLCMPRFHTMQGVSQFCQSCHSEYLASSGACKLLLFGRLVPERHEQNELKAEAKNC